MDHLEEGRQGSGIPRRTLIKRGAVAGGALMWATPVIQSLTSPVHAQASALCSVCLSATFDPDGPGGQPPTQGHIDFAPTPACCSCVAANGGGVLAVVLCGISGDCAPAGGVQQGPCA